MQPRVLLIEDDASVRRFVAMALDDLSVDIVQQESIGGALEYLFTGAPVDLVLSDLALPDGSALGLIEWLATTQRYRIAVFSAGVTPDVRARLKRVGVWRILEKPVSLAALQDCVSQGTEPAPLSDSTSDSVSLTSAVDRYFGGDHSLYNAYAESCLMNFVEDIKKGDSACADSDLSELKRLAHSLKTVLTLLGQEEHAATARMLEQFAASGTLTNAQRFWLLLRDALGASKKAEACN